MACLVGLVASCESTPGQQANLSLEVLVPADPGENPYQEVFILEFEVTRLGSQVFRQEVEFSEDWISGEPYGLAPVEFVLDAQDWDDLRLSLSGYRYVMSGNVLHARGRSATFGLDPVDGSASVSLYFSPVGRFSSPGNMVHPRFGHSASLLADGRVLIAGGATGGTPEEPTDLVAPLEIYDPGQATFSALSASTQRVFHTATLLGDGKVLLFGGLDPAGEALADTMLFDPADNSLSLLTFHSPPEARYAHSASLLTSGEVLIAGGSQVASPLQHPLALDTAIIIDPATGQTRLPRGKLTQARAFHQAVATGNRFGEILLTGGCSANEGVLDGVEVYNDDDGWFVSLQPEEGALASMNTKRVGHTATLLIDGNILLLGGSQGPLSEPRSDSILLPEVYAETMNGLVTTGSDLPAIGREAHTATLLADGRVLVAGGLTVDSTGSSEADQAELVGVGRLNGAGAQAEYTCSFEAVEDLLSAPRSWHTATLLDDGMVLLTGGVNDIGVVAAAEIYNPE